MNDQTHPSSDIHHLPLQGRKLDGSETLPLGDDPSSIMHVGQFEDEGSRNRIVSSTDLLVRCQAEGNANTHLWGRHVRAGAVTLLIGETSAGKTVFLHNLGYHLACGNEFLDVAPPSRLRVLSVDFESHYDILKEHLEIIGPPRDGTSLIWRTFAQGSLCFNV